MNLYDMLITRPLGFLINFIYGIFQDYGLAIIFFTLIIKLIILPLNIKSQKAMRKQQKIQPYINELQKKYANDKEKLQKEMMKVYKDNDVSMMGGCLPMLIQLPILFSLYHVIQRPITYLANASIDDIAAKVTTIIEKFPDVVGEVTMDAVMLAKNSQIQISTWCSKIGGEFSDWVFDFNFFGLDISQQPQAALSPLMKGDFSNMSLILLIIIPVLAVLTTMLSTKVTQSQNKNNNNEQMESTMGTMNLIMPLMTGWFTFILPAGMGLYWIISNIFQIGQQLALNYYFDKKGDDSDVKLPENNRKKGKKR